MGNQNENLSRRNSMAHFFKEIKSELGPVSSRKVIIMIRKVFRDIQNGLSGAEKKMMMARLPKYLALLFYGDSSDQGDLPYDHLDQWVANLSREDQSSHEQVFYSEISVLRTLVCVLTKLDKQCGLLNFPGFKHSLVRELKEASI
ncbi:MAG TPA: hypothetical protein VFW11_13430 [Cyclobacteriaceae bacterium]|nr:hypothetical protein [Cyclobacteriaceae bacterium]